MTPTRNPFYAIMQTIKTTALPLLGVALIAMTLTGCNKQPDKSGSSGTGTADPSEAALVDLTQALRRYAMEHRGLPKNFDELAAAGYLKPVPTAPAGKKFEIDAKTTRVILVKQ